MAGCGERVWCRRHVWNNVCMLWTWATLTKYHGVFSALPGFHVAEHQQERCQLPLDTGSCESGLPRFYFDHVTGECRHFLYGGCQGNDNNFLSLSDCLRVCTQFHWRTRTAQWHNGNLCFPWKHLERSELVSKRLLLTRVHVLPCSQASVWKCLWKECAWQTQASAHAGRKWETGSSWQEWYSAMIMIIIAIISILSES